MLRTSVVDAVNPDLANALTGLDGGALTLAALEHSGTPLHPADADGHGNWYRFHPLFRELLRAHLHHAHPEEIPFLHRRAARWYANEGQTRRAIRHALAGQDWEQAGNLIAENWLDLFLAGRSAAMRGPMAALPADVLSTDPRLAAAFAGSRLQDGDLDGAARHLTLARQARAELDGEPREQLDVTLAVLALHVARLRVRDADAKRLAGKLTALARGGAHPSWPALRSFALANLGATRLWSGDPRAATADLQEALALATEHHHEQIAVDCMAQLAIVHLLGDRLAHAEELATRAAELAEQRGWCDGPAAASAYLAGAAVAYRRGEFEHAEGLLSHASSAAETAEAPVRAATALLQALTLASAGPRSAARGAMKLRALRAAELDEPLPPFLKIALADIESRVLLAAGDPQEARAALARSCARLEPCPELLLREAAIDLHVGEPESAAQSLASLLQEPAHEARTATLLEAWLLRALADHACGERPAAAQALDSALALAEREPFRDAFLLNGPGVRELLEIQAQIGTAHPALLEVLLEGAGQHKPTTALAEPLTEREQRILRYLPTMLSNAEIGAEVFVSLNTVKTHLRSIYRKLGANGRADAVEKARALGLLPSGIKRPRVTQRT
ncbi:MAG TPA: LuxR C-terminal-related transcriptional regulator, partial [Solirubrobacteraceae bacterium]